ncbi:mycothiol system anti-sigma-R factor [Trueperella pecoris]|uniref:Mycothiol system anti-sigma-R factor n=1 Tax=Trueperella pecoris TaxID=2733571 RepID=A0A7M1QX64_9ACTO|nr:mycothiol system anti-sigma-R factor [Trueperella pecoris]QOQ39265.1 mycothiol system anti-sigma-R factor [Trueperella pecoris]QOR46094.1 mycothiol system anti-sigma-R factor [Trueperella pecoris]
MSKEFDQLVAKLEECSCAGTNCGCKGCRCDEVLERLFELLDDEVCEEDAHRLLKHGRTCASCSTRIEEEILLRRVIRRGCCSESAPESLRMKITNIVTR